MKGTGEGSGIDRVSSSSRILQCTGGSNDIELSTNDVVSPRHNYPLSAEYHIPRKPNLSNL